jgi:hypothetical protein
MSAGCSARGLSCRVLARRAAGSAVRRVCVLLVMILVSWYGYALWHIPDAASAHANQTAQRRARMQNEVV